jgi:hypothetical protein
MSAARFRPSELTRAAVAMRKAGVESFDVLFDAKGLPIVRVRPGAANDTPQDVLDEIEAWARESQDDAA